MTRISIVLCLVGCMNTAHAAEPVQSAPIVLTGATLIDGTGAPAVPDAWVRIEGERIAAMGTGAPPASSNARVLRLEGKTLLPGLGDMHVHLGSLAQARWMLKLLLAHGVTNVKETGNRIGHLAAIRRWMETEDPLPHVSMSGATLNGDREDLRFLKSGGDTRQRLENNGAFGVEFIKIHNFVSTGALRQIASYCERNDLYLTGHVPLGMTSVAAIDAGMKILEHVRLRPAEVLDDPALIERYPIDIVLMRRTGYWAHLDPESDNLGRTLNAWRERRNEFFFDPTLVTHHAIAHADEPGTTAAPEVELVSPRTLESWRGGTARYGDLDAEERAEAKRSARGMVRFAGLAYGIGVRILTGTDTPIPWVVPGHGLHRELELLVEAGLTPVEAIHSSTGRVAEALRKDDRGVVAVGKRADLVIVAGDVASDVTRVRQVERVILGGRFHERAQLLEEARRWAREDRHPADEETSSGALP